MTLSSQNTFFHIDCLGLASDVCTEYVWHTASFVLSYVTRRPDAATRARGRWWSRRESPMDNLEAILLVFALLADNVDSCVPAVRNTKTSFSPSNCFLPKSLLAYLSAAVRATTSLLVLLVEDAAHVIVALVSFFLVTKVLISSVLAMTLNPPFHVLLRWMSRRDHHKSSFAIESRSKDVLSGGNIAETMLGYHCTDLPVVWWGIVSSL